VADTIIAREELGVRDYKRREDIGFGIFKKGISVEFSDSQI
jgi:hypothetical protein